MKACAFISIALSKSYLLCFVQVDNTPIGEKYIGRDTIRHFVDTYRSPESDSYIISELPKQMYHEVGVLPSLGACGDMTKSFVEIDLWWSGGGSKSIIHKVLSISIF